MWVKIRGYVQPHMLATRVKSECMTNVIGILSVKMIEKKEAEREATSAAE